MISIVLIFILELCLQLSLRLNLPFLLGNTFIDILVLLMPSSEFPTSMPTKSPTSSNPLPLGIIIGSVVGATVFIVVAVYVWMNCCGSRSGAPNRTDRYETDTYSSKPTGAASSTYGSSSKYLAKRDNMKQPLRDADYLNGQI